MVFIMGHAEECRCYREGQNRVRKRREEGTSWHDVPKERILNKEGEIFPGQEWAGFFHCLWKESCVRFRFADDFGRKGE